MKAFLSSKTGSSASKALSLLASLIEMLPDKKQWPKRDHILIHKGTLSANAHG